MNSVETLKQKLRKGNVPEAIAQIITQTAELKITTSIEASDKAQSLEYLTTTINCVTGSITEEISPNLWENQAYQHLLSELHSQEITQGQKIIFAQLKYLPQLLQYSQIES